MRRPVVTIIAALALAALSVPPITADQILIPAGSAWRYNDTGTDLGTAWRATGFNDTAWASGNAQLGYGDGDESALLSYGSTSNRRITYYFRKQFIVATPGAVERQEPYEPDVVLHHWRGRNRQPGPDGQSTDGLGVRGLLDARDPVGNRS